VRGELPHHLRDEAEWCETETIPYTLSVSG